MRAGALARISFLFTIVLISSTSFGQNLTKDVELGKEYAERVEKVFGVYEDPEMEAYVESIGKRLVAALDEPHFDYSFKIIPTPTPNAFALPGGYTYVTTGLLPVLETEDELACIMAHEIIHANNRHAIKSMKRGIIPAVLQLPGNVIGLVSPGAGEMINRPIKGFGDLGMASYSRKNETEADVDGSALASKAGYNPEALQSALNRIGKYIELLTGEKEEKGYLDDHPMTADRVERLKKEAAKLEFTASDPLSPSFKREFRGLLYGENPIHGIIIDSVFYNPEHEFRVNIPEGWVGQIHPETFAMMDTTRRASIYVTYSESDSTPGEKAAILRNQLPEPYKQIMVLDQEVHINNEPAYMMAFEQRSQNNEVYAFMLWFRKGGTLFEFSAMTRPELRTTIEHVPYTLAELDDRDKEKLTIERLELVKSRDNESLEEFNSRISNTLPKEITALINNLSPGQSLPDGKELKVVLKEPYFKD
jgi:predicted Zn-dependent protease